MKKSGQVFRLFGVLMMVSLLVIGCGSGGGGDGGGGGQPAQTETANDTTNDTSDTDPDVNNDNDDTANENIVISGTLSDSVVSSKPRHQKFWADGMPFYRRSVATWANAIIQAIDEYGNVVASTTSDSNGNYSLSVSPGNNYFLKASLGNLVLKTFIENVHQI